MKRLLLAPIAALYVFGCKAGAMDSCNDVTAKKCPPCPCATGGAAGTGGAKATGGSRAMGGEAAVGGKAATGGGSAVVVVFPACGTTESFLSQGEPERHRLGAKPTAPRAPQLLGETAPVTGASSFFGSPCTALDQDVSPYTGQATGSCTGNDAAQTSSTPPYGGTCAQRDEKAALLCYEDATNIDNGCAWNATTKQCPAAFSPITDANDNGSSADSTFAIGVKLGWFTGLRSVVQTIQGWHDALALGPCGFDQPWYNAGFQPSQCGEVSLAGGLAGYHSTEAVGFDVPNQRMWLRNSWGPKFGVGGGYFFYSYASLVSLYASGARLVCPALPTSSRKTATFMRSPEKAYLAVYN